MKLNWGDIEICLKHIQLSYTFRQMYMLVMKQIWDQFLLHLYFISALYNVLVYGQVCNEYKMLHDLSCMNLEGYWLCLVERGEKASSLSSWLLSGKYTLLALYSRKYLIIPSLSQMNAHNEPNVQRIICSYCVYGANYISTYEL